MRSIPLRSLLAVLLLLLLVRPAPGAAGTNTLGLILNTPDAFVGYTLFEQLQYHTTYLIDNEGRIVHAWEDHEFSVGNMAYLLDDGSLLRPANPGGNPVFMGGGAAGLVQRIDWDGALQWEFLYSDATVRAHHELEALPNGNVLILAWEYHSAAEAIAAGRDPSTLNQTALWGEHVVEVEPVGANGGNIVWEWHLWDHLIQDFDATKANFGVVGDHPELLDINARMNGAADWVHANAVAYHADFDQIIVNSAFLSEFYVIDHGTTSAEAAGHAGGPRGMGGDILYRWGNPANYDRGTTADRQLFRQHDSHWIPDGLPGAGNVLVFNNGPGRPAGNFSTIEEIVTTVDANGDYPVPPSGMPHGPASPTWTYVDDPPNSFYSSIMSGAQRMPNGNTLICSGYAGRIFEVKAGTDEDVWRYIVPVSSGGPLMQGDPPLFNSTFQAERYPPDFPGFDGRDLTPGPPVEVDPATFVAVAPPAGGFVVRQNRPNPFRESTTIRFALARPGRARLDVYDVGGRLVRTLLDRPLEAGEHAVPWNAGDVPGGVYFYALRTDAGRQTRRAIVLR